MCLVLSKLSDSLNTNFSCVLLCMSDKLIESEFHQKEKNNINFTVFF